VTYPSIRHHPMMGTLRFTHPTPVVNKYLFLNIDRLPGAVGQALQRS
jgi:hypothetical protein